MDPQSTGEALQVLGKLALIIGGGCAVCLGSLYIFVRFFLLGFRE
jgi:hypothetical protein